MGHMEGGISQVPINVEQVTGATPAHCRRRYMALGFQQGAPSFSQINTCTEVSTVGLHSIHAQQTLYKILNGVAINALFH